MNNPQHNSVNFFLLAGGKSSRMGTDKGLLIMQGKHLIEFAIEQIKPLAKNIFIVTENKEYAKFKLPLISDEIKDIGPVGGIYTALKQSDSELNFIISCDMPFITKDAIAFLISIAGNFEITLPVNEGMLEPLFAIYSKSCSEKLVEHIQQGNYKLQELVNHFKVQKINVDSHPLFSKKIFMNINTPQDLEKANLL